MTFDVLSGVLGLALGAGATLVSWAAFVGRRRRPVYPIISFRRGPVGRPETVTASSPRPECAAPPAPAAVAGLAEDLACRFRISLNAVLGFCDILLTDRSAPPSPRQAQSLGEIRTAGLTLLNIVEAEIERSADVQTPFEPVTEAAAVLPLLHQICDLNQAAAVAAGVDLAPPKGAAELRVLADRRQLREVLQILLTQVMAAATPGATLIPLARRERDFVEISVIVRNPPDLGFTVTAPVPPAAPTPGGDLDRARALASAMGGRLQARAPGRGDPSMALLLPPAVGAGTPPPFTKRYSPSGQSAAAFPRRPVILYVEDDVSNAQLMRRVLDRLGAFDLYIAETGRDGLRMADQSTPDLIILDIDLPDLDGWTVKAMMANTDNTRDIPVLAMSASASAQDVRRGIEAGFLDYLTKPLDPALLAMSLNRSLGVGLARTDRPVEPESRRVA